MLGQIGQGPGDRGGVAPELGRHIHHQPAAILDHVLHDLDVLGEQEVFGPQALGAEGLILGELMLAEILATAGALDDPAILDEITQSLKGVGYAK